MKFITLILLVILLTACGAADNPLGRENSRNGPNNRNNRDVNRPPATSEDEEINFPKFTRSQAFRTRGADQLTNENLQQLVKAGKIPAWLHLIPDPTRDTEQSIPPFVAPETNCGIGGTFTTISARLADCRSKNPVTHNWNGKTYGISGEGNWSLLTKEQNLLVWIDQTTGLVWSDNIQNATWNTASGARGMENSAVCTANIQEAALGKIPPEQIRWRLPTRSDFLLADINGARFVLPSLNEQYWSASHDGLTAAWSIFQNTGILKKEAESESLAVRCVGIIKQ